MQDTIDKWNNRIYFYSLFFGIGIEDATVQDIENSVYEIINRGRTIEREFQRENTVFIDYSQCRISNGFGQLEEFIEDIWFEENVQDNYSDRGLDLNNTAYL